MRYWIFLICILAFIAGSSNSLTYAFTYVRLCNEGSIKLNYVTYHSTTILFSSRSELSGYYELPPGDCGHLLFDNWDHVAVALFHKGRNGVFGNPVYSLRGFSDSLGGAKWKPKKICIPIDVSNEGFTFNGSQNYIYQEFVEKCRPGFEAANVSFAVYADNVDFTMNIRPNSNINLAPFPTIIKNKEYSKDDNLDQPIDLPKNWIEDIFDDGASEKEEALFHIHARRIDDTYQPEDCEQSSSSDIRIDRVLHRKMKKFESPEDITYSLKMSKGQEYYMTTTISPYSEQYPHVCEVEIFIMDGEMSKIIAQSRKSIVPGSGDYCAGLKFSPAYSGEFLWRMQIRECFDAGLPLLSHHSWSLLK